jgi:hypothetical protein
MCYHTRLVPSLTIYFLWLYTRNNFEDQNGQMYRFNDVNNMYRFVSCSFKAFGAIPGVKYLCKVIQSLLKLRCNMYRYTSTQERNSYVIPFNTHIDYYKNTQRLLYIIFLLFCNTLIPDIFKIIYNNLIRFMKLSEITI